MHRANDYYSTRTWRRGGVDSSTRAREPRATESAPRAGRVPGPRAVRFRGGGVRLARRLVQMGGGHWAIALGPRRVP